jgi:hypothetical protein
MHNLEISATLPAARTALVYGPGVVAQAPAELKFGYFPGEDRRDGAPFKITIQTGLNDFREFALTRYQVAGIVRHWWHCLKLRALAPNRKQDNEIQPPNQNE